MKKLFTILISTLLFSFVHAQYNSTLVNNQPINKTIGKIASDVNDNLVISGTFATSITFGSYTLTSNVPVNGVPLPVFVARRSSTGSFTYAKSFEPLPLTDNTTSYVLAYGVYTDASGNAFLTGQFRGKVQFDNTVLSSTKNGSSYTTDMFTIKINNIGSVQWVKQEGSNSVCTNLLELGQSVTGDNSGNVYATGRIFTKVGSKMLPCSYVVKYNSSGIKVWEKKYYNAQSSNCGSDVIGNNIRCDGTNTYVVGQFNGSISFGTVTLNTGSEAIRNAYLLKLNSSGQTTWAKSVTGSHNITYASGDGQGYFDEDNNEVYITGIFYAGNSISFGTCSLTTDETTSYIAKYSSDGNCVWAQKEGAIITGITNHPNGTIAILQQQNLFTIKELNIADGLTLNTIIPTYTTLPTLSNGSGFIKTANGFLFSQNLNGSYTLEGTTISSTGSSYSDLLYIKYTTPQPPQLSGSVNSTNTLDEINIFPNPVSDQLFLQNKKGKILGEIFIYNSFGTIVEQNYFANSNGDIDISHFPAGVYLVRTSNTKPTKLVKK